MTTGERQTHVGGNVIELPGTHLLALKCPGPLYNVFVLVSIVYHDVYISYLLNAILTTDLKGKTNGPHMILARNHVSKIPRRKAYML